MTRDECFVSDVSLKSERVRFRRQEMLNHGLSASTRICAYVFVVSNGVFLSTYGSSIKFVCRDWQIASRTIPSRSYILLNFFKLVRYCT